MAITLSAPVGKYKYLIGGEIDVIKNCEWAVFDGKSMKASEVPSIRLKEYQPIGDQFSNRALQFAKQATAQESLDAYKNTYKAKPTTNEYVFPYFTTEMRTKSNSWQEDKRVVEYATGIGGGLLGNSKVGSFLQSPAVQQFAKVAASSFASGIAGAGLGIEYPKMWQGADAAATYSFDFYLFNTVAKEKITDNWNLVRLLTHNNSYNRRNLVLQDAPVLYSVDIPGIRKSPVAAMKELKIEMVGQSRKISGVAPVESIIPEAYHISITMEDLFVESRQILNAVNGGKIVEVFTR